MDPVAVCDSILSFIRDHSFERVGIQVEPKYLSFATPLILHLRRLLLLHGRRGDDDRPLPFLVLLADSCPPCCVDTLSAQRLQLQGMVLLGLPCDSLPSSLPTLLVPPRLPLPTTLPRTINNNNNNKDTKYCMVLHPSLWHHYDALTSYCNYHSITLLQRPKYIYYPHDSSPSLSMVGYSHCLYICNNDSTTTTAMDPHAMLISLQCQASNVEWILISNNNTSNNTSNTSNHCNDVFPSSQFYSRRMSLYQRLKQQKAVGVLSFSPSLPSSGDLLHNTCDELRHHNIVPYPLCIGRPTPTKLLNFSLLSVFISLGCPLDTITTATSLSNSHIALITPLEMRMALRPNNVLWTPVFLHQPLKNNNNNDDDDNDDVDNDDVDVDSNVSHAIVHHRGALQLSVMSVSPAAAALRSNNRWIGVDPNAPRDVSLAQHGTMGIAASYDHEPKHHQHHQQPTKQNTVKSQQEKRRQHVQIRRDEDSGDEKEADEPAELGGLF